MAGNGLNRRRGGGKGRLPLFPSIDRLRQTEVQHLHLAFGSNHHIGWFQVPVDNAAGVSGCQSISDLRADSQCLNDGERPRGTLAFDQFQNQEVGPVELLEAVNRANMGVVHRSESPRFTTEPGHTLPIASELIWQRFNGNIAAEFGVVRPVDFPHAAHSERRHDAVVAKLPAGKRSGGADRGSQIRDSSFIKKTAGVFFR